MKKMMILGIAVSMAVVGFCQSEIAALEYEPSPFVTSFHNEIEATGSMMLKDGTWIIRVTNRNDVIDYVPTNLDVDFKIEGLAVHFKGELEDIPDNVRLIGQPVKILTIERVQ